jgi:hypothetical protein
MSEKYFEINDLVEIVNAVHPESHSVGDVVPVWGLQKEDRNVAVPNSVGGATLYSFDDVKISHRKGKALVPEQVMIDTWKAEVILLMVKQLHSPLAYAVELADSAYESINGDINATSPQDVVNQEAKS